MRKGTGLSGLGLTGGLTGLDLGLFSRFMKYDIQKFIFTYYTE
jgi:hypothetical protein